jgi:hypothetical protein
MFNLTYAGNVFMDRFVDVGININNRIDTQHVKALKLKENKIKKGTILSLRSGGYDLIDSEDNPLDVNVKDIYAVVRYYIPEEVIKKVDISNINDQFIYQERKRELFKHLHEYLYEDNNDDDYILFSNNDDNENLKEFKIFFGLLGYKGYPPMFSDKKGVIEYGGSLSLHKSPQVSCYLKNYKEYK